MIEAAAERQAAFLRTLQIGPQAEMAARILNEVASARITLQNVDRKMGYDAALKQQQTETEQQSQTAAPHSRESAPVTPVQKDEQSDTTESVEPLVSDDFGLPEPAAHSIQITTDSILASTGKRHRHKSWKTTRSVTSIVLGGLAVICVTIILLWTFWGGGPSGIVKQPSSLQQDRKDTPADNQPSVANQPSAANQPSKDNPNPRFPVPDKDARTKSRALLDDLFERDYDEPAKIPEPRKRHDALKALAAEMYSLCLDEDDPVIRYVLLEVTVRIATESGDPDLTTEIIDDLAAPFDVDDLPLRVTAVNLWTKQAVQNYRGEELLQIRLIVLDLIVPLAERAESEHRYGTAAELYTLASKQANRERQADFRKIALALQKKANIHDRMMKLEKELESQVRIVAIAFFSRSFPPVHQPWTSLTKKTGEVYR